MAEEFTFKASELSQPSGSYEPVEFSFSADEIAPKAQNTQMEHFRAAQKALAQSPQWKGADSTQKKRLMANLQDTVFGGGYAQSQQKSEYKPESFAKGLGRKAIRYTGAALGGVGGGLVTSPTVIGMGPGVTAGTMAGYGVGKATEEALMGPEPTPPPKERVFKGGTLRQGLAEAIYNVPESAANLAEGAIAFPSALGKAAMTKGGGKQVIEDTAHMFGAPLGFYGSEAAKDAWVLDPAGAALAPTMIVGGMKGLKSKGMAEPKLDQYIAKKYPNAVGMSSAGMRRSPDVQRHLADAQGAIKTITALKDEGIIQVGDGLAREVRLPKNRMEFSDAIGQAKDHVFNIYNTLKQKAGEQGIVIESEPLQSQLRAIGEDAGLRVMRPEIIKSATELADRFAQEGPLTPDAATSIIKSANDSYKDFLKNPSAETGGKAILDAMVANNLRKAMETKIDSEVGPGWQAYRNKYKQLSTIEKEVTKGAVVDARKSPIGLLDFTDMFSAGEAVSGIISLNPAQFAKGGTMFMIKRIYKKLKDPNTAVEKMFRMTDKHYKRPDKMSAEPWIPAGPPEAPPLDMSFNPETVPGRQSSQMTEIPGSMAKGLEEGGYRFEPPQTVTREQTIANPEQLPGTSYRQETIDPSAPQVITRQKTVENPEQLPGKQSSYTDQEMAPQGNTNVDLMAMTTKLKEFGYTPEEIQQFIPKAMKAGVPIAAVTAYLLADDETKKQMRTTMPMLGMIAMGKGKTGNKAVANTILKNVVDKIKTDLGVDARGVFKILPNNETKGIKLWRLDHDTLGSPKENNFKLSEFGRSEELEKPLGKFWAERPQDAGSLLSGSKNKEGKIHGKEAKELLETGGFYDGLSSELNSLDNHISWGDYGNPSYTVGRPVKNSIVAEVSLDGLNKIKKDSPYHAEMLTAALKDAGVDFVRIKGVDLPYIDEIIQLNKETVKVRGRQGLYSVLPIAVLPLLYSKKEL